MLLGAGLGIDPERAILQSEDTDCILRAGNVGVNWCLLMKWFFFVCRGTCWRKTRMKRKIFSCELECSVIPAALRLGAWE